MRRALTALAALALIAPSAPAQSAEPFRPEIRPLVAAWVPMGAMRDDFRDALTVGGQVALELNDYWHLVGMFGVTNGKNRFGGLWKAKTYLIHYDLGAESNLLVKLQHDWIVKPFAGLGVGARSYDYLVDAVDNRICSSGYGALGSELQRGSFGLRVEARQYVSCFESPITGTKKTRTDGLYSLGLAYHMR